MGTGVVTPPTQQAEPTANAMNPSAPTSTRRGWNLDEIVVSAFAIFGVAGAVFLPLAFGFNKIPPIVVSFLLATGLAALAYRYLGGIQGTSYGIGALKLTGSLGALVGIAMLINQFLPAQVTPYQVWQVSGQVVQDTGQPVEPLGIADFALDPEAFHHSDAGGFTLKISSAPGVAGKIELPTLRISHAPFDTAWVDLNHIKPPQQRKLYRLGTDLPAQFSPKVRPTSGSPAAACC
jgi:hypothetical protein